MPVIIVKAREGVIGSRERKAELIEALADAFARVTGDPTRKAHTTVLIEELPDENWGRGGRQVGAT